MTVSDAVLDELARLLGHVFSDRRILEQALTHSSAATAANPDTYQRLEFLGDRVLGLVVADMVFEAFPDADEGELSRRLTLMVRRETCAAVARDIGLGGFVQLGGGEAQSGGRSKEAILADVCEAVIGALYRDGGLPAARQFVETHWALRMRDTAPRLKDAKTALQEWAHAQGLEIPSYAEVERAGPDHEPVFTISVTIPGLAPAMASGGSKRIAEQAAAERLLRREGAWKDSVEK
jgi:ribonuclease III